MSVKPIFEIFGNSLSNCRTAPIAYPGVVQSFGAVLVYDLEDKQVLRASTNLASFIPQANARASVPLKRCLPDNILEIVMSLETSRERSVVLPRQGTTAEPGVAIWATLHRQGRTGILEFERDTSGAVPTMTPERMSHLTSEIVLLAEENFYTALLETLQSIMPFDRMMIYKFDENWNGEVIAESLRADISSYLHHWFPEGDIPPPAREMYLFNPVRLIADISARSVPVVDLDESVKDSRLDLSKCTSRGAAPVHLEYLRNMRVEASSSFAIIVRGRLWGIVACHNRVPRYLNPECRSWVTMLLRTVSLKISEMELSRATESVTRQRELVTRLLDAGETDGGLQPFLEMGKEKLLQLVSADGFACVVDDKIQKVGAVPSEKWLKTFAGHFEAVCEEDGHFATHALTEVVEDYKVSGSDSAGVLAVRIPRSKNSWFMWFRNSTAKEILWGGDPRKPPELEKYVGRIHPRKSFETWKQTEFHHAASWTPLELSAAKDAARILVSRMQ